LVHIYTSKHERDNTMTDHILPCRGWQRTPSHPAAPKIKIKIGMHGMDARVGVSGKGRGERWGGSVCTWVSCQGSWSRLVFGCVGDEGFSCPPHPRPVPLGCPHCVPSAQAPAATLLKMKYYRGRGEERLVGGDAARHSPFCTNGKSDARIVRVALGSRGRGCESLLAGMRLQKIVASCANYPCGAKIEWL
jgi:hypothetical protein